MLTETRSKSNQMKEWTLASALVWMVRKSPKEVDRLAPDGRLHIGRIGDFMADCGQAWIEQLRPSLFAGTLQAFAAGWNAGEKRTERLPVEPHLWRDAKLSYQDIDEKWYVPFVCVPASHKERGHGLFEMREITFFREDIQALFPSPVQQSLPYEVLKRTPYQTRFLRRIYDAGKRKGACAALVFASYRNERPR